MRVKSIHRKFTDIDLSINSCKINIFIGYPLATTD